jgi:hypothetical protein
VFLTTSAAAGGSSIYSNIQGKKKLGDDDKLFRKEKNKLKKK